ncbi:Beta-glucosidase [Actinidia chinensis var. chinensis]|uniref:Beta-glucosidase n=1 Tax=Actinidia chinensis var. chinensis TaxID=1590841 RepID=A0A2R6PWK1_ACTCC|nr:Beta-glucosidase [Actinidia chinensis var. chinensis]
MAKTTDRKRLVEEEWNSILSKQPSPLSRTHFPPQFIFGSATSAYQVEGAWNEGGRGPSIWDSFSHAEGKICDGSNGDIAVDQYHRYKEDIELIAKLGFGAYRFSISWSRIFPDGLGTQINEEGITYYNNVINALLERGIQPFVTLYHWDLPLNLQESMGGWLNEEVVKYFAIYAEICFASFGDRVKNWITINEPLQTAVNGYVTGIFAPGRCEHGSTEPYLVAHHQLLAHAEAVSTYRNKYQDKQKGQIGLVVDCEWAEALSDKIEDRKAAARRIDFQLGWYLDPIFYGDYPETMREKLGDQLPKFSHKNKELLKNSVDFIGLNHYTSRFIAHSTNCEDNCFYRAQEMESIAEWEGGEVIGEKAASPWLYVVPWGIRKLLNYIAQRYNNPPVYVTENGMDDDEDGSCPLNEMLDDKLRVCYYKGYLTAVAQAIKDGTDVRGYFAWSLLDNFEWSSGYTRRFGLVYVDYKNGLSRHLKSSAYWFLRFLKGGEEKNGKEE